MQNLSTLKLLNLYGEVLDELSRRGVVRTRNAPISDYAEWLVAKALELELENNSNSGHDAVGKNRITYQIKCRRLTKENSSRQLGVIRDLEKKPFNKLIAVLFNQNFTVKEAYAIPLPVIKVYAKYSKHQNGHILILKGKVLKDKRIRNLAQQLQNH